MKPIVRKLNDQLQLTYARTIIVGRIVLLTRSSQLRPTIPHPCSASLSGAFAQWLHDRRLRPRRWSSTHLEGRKAPETIQDRAGEEVIPAKSQWRKRRYDYPGL